MRRLAVGAALAFVLAGCTNSANQPPPEPFGTRAATRVLEDGLLYAAVKAKLTADDPDSTTSLRVGVDSGVVTLSGSVRTAGDRTRALGDARGVRGVTRDVDDLRVNPAGPHPRQQVADFALAARVEGAILAEAGFQRVEVLADHGVATLSGTVRDAATKARVVTAARNTDGVRNVVDRLRVGGT
jgi:hyperosmotically inducible protein